MKKETCLKPPVPDNELQRLQALQQYQIMDTLPEADFDDLTRRASFICQTPISLISLIDANRQWFKSGVGLTVTEIARNISFCQYAIMGEQVYEVPNALENEHFAKNPLVTGNPHIRFYAGAPLINPQGLKLGTLCVIDTIPKTLTDAQRNALQIIARQVMTQLELRRQSKQLAIDNIHLAKYRIFSINTTEMMCIVDARTFLFEEVNEAFKKIAGYEREEVTGKQLLMYLHEEDIPKMMEMLMKGLHEETEVYEFENRLVCKDGSLRWLSWNGISRNGKWYANARDITRRHEIEEKLCESTQSLIETQAIAHVGGWEFNLATQEITWSDETFRLFSLEPAERAPTFDEYLRLLHPDDVPLMLEKIEQAVQYQTPYVVELRVIWPDGSIHYLVGRGQMKITAGRPSKLIGTVLDITERKLGEIELLRAKEQAEHSTKAKEMFLSTMSHEIRTPMNAVIGMTHLLMEEAPRPSQMEYLKTLRFSAENLLVLINDILDFSKIEAGKITFESINFNLRALLNGIRNSLTYLAEEKRLQFNIQLDASLPEVVIGDPVRLSQVLTNLISNAIKFTEKGSVEVGLSVQNETKEAITIDFTVRDTGIGIAEDKLSCIFESFTQASSDTTRRFGGTGLGLAITKRLLELKDSQLCVQSKEGEGSVFSFTATFQRGYGELPANTSLGSLTSHERANLQDVQLLLVEDNEVNQLIASKFLTKWGIQFDYAKNGLVAVEKIKNKRYDIVLMDLQMPEMDGYEATKIIRSLDGAYYQELPIVALTASAMLDVKDKVFTIGMTDYLSKPFNPDELYQKISKYTKKSTQIEKSATLSGLVPEEMVNFTRLTEATVNNPGFARQMIMLSLEALDNFKEQYRFAILSRDLTKLKAIHHKSHFLFHLLELALIQSEINHGEQLLKEGQSEEATLLESSCKIQELCEMVIATLKNKLDNLVPQ